MSSSDGLAPAPGDPAGPGAGGPPHAADASTWVRVMAPLLFALAWMGMAFRWPWLPVGRTLSTMVCAVLAVSLGVISPEEAFASVSLPTLALLFGSMVMATLLEREGFFTHVQRLWCAGLPTGSGGGTATAAGAADASADAAHVDVAPSNRGWLRGRFQVWMSGQGEYAAHHLLLRVVFSSGLLSALFTNDSWCVVGTPVLLRLCARFRLPYAPFLLALATSANIGSAASPVGNPQNMLIAASSGIGFSQFLRFLLLPTLLGLAVNGALLCAVYHAQLKGHRITWTEALLARADANQPNEEEDGQEQGEMQQGECVHRRRPSISELVESAKMLPPSSEAELRAQRRHSHQYERAAGGDDDDADAELGSDAQADLHDRAPGPSASLRRVRGSAQEVKSPGDAGEADDLLYNALSPASAFSSSSSSSSLRPLQSVVWPVTAAVQSQADAHSDAVPEDSEAAFAALDSVVSSSPHARNNVDSDSGHDARPPPRRAGVYPDLEPFLSAAGGSGNGAHWARDEYVRRVALEHFYGVDWREAAERDEKANRAKSGHGNDGGGGGGGHAAPPPPLLRYKRGGRYASPALPSSAASALFNARARANNMPISPPLPEEEEREGIVGVDEENPALATAASATASSSSLGAASARPSFSFSSNVGGRAGRLEMQPPSYASLSTPIRPPAAPQGALAVWLDRQGPLCSSLARCGSVSKVRLFSFVLLCTLVAFLAGAPLAWAALGGAVAMLLADGVDPDLGGLWHSAGVDWALLLFFSALFVVVDALRISGWPERAWAAAAPALDVRTAGGAALYSLLILLGSNTVSNVPLVLILAPSLRALPDPVARHAAWLLLAFVSTLAGNLTLVGSVANLIVVARARAWYELKFWEYARFGSWTTVLLIAGGVAIILVELP